MHAAAKMRHRPRHPPGSLPSKRRLLTKGPSGDPVQLVPVRSDHAATRRPKSTPPRPAELRFIPRLPGGAGRRAIGDPCGRWASLISVRQASVPDCPPGRTGALVIGRRRRARALRPMPRYGRSELYVVVRPFVHGGGHSNERSTTGATLPGWRSAYRTVRHDVPASGRDDSIGVAPPVGPDAAACDARSSAISASVPGNTSERSTLADPSTVRAARAKPHLRLLDVVGSAGARRSCPRFRSSSASIAAVAPVDQPSAVLRVLGRNDSPTSASALSTHAPDGSLTDLTDQCVVA